MLLGLIANAFVAYAWSLNCTGKGNEVGGGGEPQNNNFELLRGNITVSWITKANRGRQDGAGRQAAAGCPFLGLG